MASDSHYSVSPGCPTGLNEPCPCGSGEKWKYCHGVRPVIWGAFLDDTEAPFDVTSGRLLAPSKTWSAILVPPHKLSSFRRSAARVVAEYCNRWHLEELHWYDLMNNDSIRDRIHFDDLVILARRMKTIVEDTKALILMQSATDETFSDTDPFVEAARTWSGIRSSLDRDDSSLFLLLSQVHCVAFGNAIYPADELLVAIDQRPGARKWSAGSTLPAPFPRYVSDVVHVAGSDWPEVQIADFVSFSYQRMNRMFAKGQVGGVYRELVEIFSSVNRRRLSTSTSLMRANLVEKGVPALSIEVDFVKDRTYTSRYYKRALDRCCERALARFTSGDLS
jgi:hypothetical protein